MNIASINYFENLEKDLICYLVEKGNFNVAQLTEHLNKSKTECKRLYEIIEKEVLISYIDENEENFTLYPNDKELINYVKGYNIGSGETIKELLENSYVLDNFVYFMNNYKIYSIEAEYYIVYFDN